VRCPFCNETRDKVVDSRESHGGAAVRRRRECLGCGRRFTTYERLDEILHQVVKKDDRREPFNRQKLLSGLQKACEKRTLAPPALERIVNEVEDLLHNREEKEMTTREIGEHVMRRLAELDHIAFVRFASVYREFHDVTEFAEEIERLRDQAVRPAPEGAETPSEPVEDSPPTSGAPRRA
jgi:transcriptional repressor NrdR